MMDSREAVTVKGRWL